MPCWLHWPNHANLATNMTRTSPPHPTANTMTTPTSTPLHKHNPRIATKGPWKHPWNHLKSQKTNRWLSDPCKVCTAVSIDTCTALVRFIGHLWRHNLMRVGVPMGFCKPLTCAHENPCPWTWVWVLMGMGAGYSGKPQGSLWHSLLMWESLAEK